MWRPCSGRTVRETKHILTWLGWSLGHGSSLHSECTLLRPEMPLILTSSLHLIYNPSLSLVNIWPIGLACQFNLATRATKQTHKTVCMSYLASDLLPCLSVLSLVRISPIGLSVLVSIINTGQTANHLGLVQKRALRLGLPHVQQFTFLSGNWNGNS